MNIEVGCAYPMDALYANVRANADKCKNWLAHTPAHDGHAVLIGGGPSLADKLETVKWRAGLGQKIFALNGACRFLNQNGLVPDYQVFLDANPDMGERIGIAKNYLVASQCAPQLLDHLPADGVTLWHFGLPELEEHLPDHDAAFNIIGGGVTVGLTAMCMAFAMGYRKLHLFGYDSSSRHGSDHAYDVPISEERIGGAVYNSVPVAYGGKNFESTLSMAYQAELFPRVCNNLMDAGCIITVDCDRDSLIMAVLNEMQRDADAQSGKP